MVDEYNGIAKIYRQSRDMVGLPMMVLALVIGKGSGNDNEGCRNKINDDDDCRFDSCLVH